MQLLIERLRPLIASETGPSPYEVGTASSEAHRGDVAGKTAGRIQNPATREDRAI